MKTLRVVSVFSGMGGFDLAMQRCGMKIVAQVEQDKNCLRVLQKNFPKVKRYTDVRSARVCKVFEMPDCETSCGVSQTEVAAKWPSFMVSRVPESVCPTNQKENGHSGAKKTVADDVSLPAKRKGHRRNSAKARRGVRDMQPTNEKAVRGSLPQDGESSRDALPRLQHQARGSGKPGLSCSGDCLPWAEIICAGFPCQDLSVAGKRKGLSGESSGLFYEVIRIIKEMRDASGGKYPKYALFENVPGLLSSNGGRDFACVLSSLAESGAMDIAWTILDAQWFNLPQRRQRVFIVADFGGERAAEILSVPFGSTRASPPSRESESQIAYSLQAKAGSGSKVGQAWNTTLVYGSCNVNGTPIAAAAAAATLRARADSSPSDNKDTFVVYGANNVDGVPAAAAAAAVNAGGGRRIDLRSETFIAENGNDVVSPTLRSASGMPQAWNEAFAYGQGGGIRRLTPLERLRCQGFPDDWCDDCGVSLTAIETMTGNAVAVPCVEWIARRIGER